MAGRKKRRGKPAANCSVYVIELDKAVLDDRRFREANPDHDPRKPCVYVGQTGKTPQERFETHKTGPSRQANKFVKKHGLRLKPRLYARYNPMTREEAERREGELGSRLRSKGYAAWWN